MIEELKDNQKAFSRHINLSLWLFIYSSCYAFFHIMPAFLDLEIANRLMVADLFDLFTPFVMIFLVYKIYRSVLQANEDCIDTANPIRILIILILGAITFVEGHGIHLSSNAIARHLTSMKDSSLFAMDYFFDEVLGHILWDSGIVLLSVAFIAMGFTSRRTSILRMKPLLLSFGSLLYGFTYFVNAVEGQTVVFTFPVAIILPSVIFWLCLRKRSQFFENPILFIFLFSYTIAVIFFLIWGVWNKGFPQFSELGWI